MLEIEWRVPSSLYVPPKKQLAQHIWSLVGGSRLCVDPYVRKAHGRREWLIVLASCLWFKPDFVPGSLTFLSYGEPKSSDIWSLLSHLLAHSTLQAWVHSLPGMSLAFLSSSFSLPNLSYCFNFTPIAWPMPVSSCTWNHPIQPHSNLNTEKRIFIAPNWVRKEAKGPTITCALVTFQSVFYSTLV